MLACAESLISRISPWKRFFKKNHFYLFIRSPDGLDYWNKKCQTISWQCRFKAVQPNQTNPYSDLVPKCQAASAFVLETLQGWKTLPRASSRLNSRPSAPYLGIEMVHVTHWQYKVYTLLHTGNLVSFDTGDSGPQKWFKFQDFTFTFKFIFWAPGIFSNGFKLEIFPKILSL